MIKSCVQQIVMKNRISLDGVMIYRSPTLYAWSDPLPMQVPLSSGSLLTLIVAPLVKKDCDRAI